MKDRLTFLNQIELAELHMHLGSAVSPMMLWEMAHEQGIRLPTKDFWQFEKLVSLQESKPYEEYLKMYDILEMIQSSPEAMFMAAQTAVSRAYRKNNITCLELRFNPILRNRQGERDLDHLIIFALQGLERAQLKYPVKTGVILSMDRRFTKKENTAIVDKAIKYQKRGVVGIDLAGPVRGNDFKIEQVESLVKKAKKAGLGVTIHTGEATGVDEMWKVVEFLKPDRIGHGIACVEDEKLMARLVQEKIILEICPTSNLNTQVVKDYDQIRQIFKILKQNKVSFCINTDGPEMQRVSLKEEYRRLIDYQVLTQKELLKANQTAFKSSFI